MDKKLRLVHLDISMDDDISGVSFVALVDDPATQSNFMAFNSHSQIMFKVDNEEQRIVSGVLMLADTPIYRNDSNGEYMVQFSKKSIKNMVLKLFRDGKTANVNKMHDPMQVTDNVYMFESFIIDTDRMSKPKGFDYVTNGSLFGSYKVDNEDVWNDIKEGKFKGFSIEGNFIEEQFSKFSEASLIEQIKNILLS